MADTAVTVPEPVRHVPERLAREFDDSVLTEVVDTVAQTYEELAGSARVTSFLPILTEKVARDRLSARRKRRRLASADADVALSPLAMEPARFGRIRTG